MTAILESVLEFNKCFYCMYKIARVHDKAVLIMENQYVQVRSEELSKEQWNTTQQLTGKLTRELVKEPDNRSK